MLIDPHILLQKWLRLMTTPKALRDYAVVAALLLLTFAIDFIANRNWRRYFTRHFVTDFTYYIVYYGGFYAFLYSPLGTALNGWVNRHLSFLRINILGYMPVVLQVLAFIIVTDFLSYWQHRWMHVSRPLWSLHQIHHSQEQMTIFTNYRFHIFEETFRRLFGLIPFVMLGVAPAVWVWADVLMSWVLLMQHSGNHWSYRWLDYVIVSPRYHEVHHAADAEMHDHNYSSLFPVWDYMFGTRDKVHDFADRYGVEPRIADGFWAQTLVPVREWIDQAKTRFRKRPSFPPATESGATSTYPSVQ